MRTTLRSTSTRTFVLYPAVVGLEQVVTGRRARPAGAPLLVAGFLLYRLAGAYRLPRAGGPAGMSQGMPGRLVTDGPYAVTRNPMYLGHLVFLSGLAMVSRSPISVALLAVHLPWFRARVRRDEERLRAEFGSPYDAYCRDVPRWLPRPPAGDRLRRRAVPASRRPAGARGPSRVVYWSAQNLARFSSTSPREDWSPDARTV